MFTHPMVQAWTPDRMAEFSRRPLRAYIGHRTPHACIVTYHPGSHVLPPRLDVRVHSTDGFGWGSGGPRAAQLALAILLHATGDDRAVALNLYQHFKQQVLATIHYESWLILQVDVGGWIFYKDPT